MNKKILETKDISFSYPTSKTPVLDGLNMEVHRGEKIALLGNNGAGKSTLFLTLNGILKPDLGEVYLNEEKIDYSKASLRRLRQKVGLVFQNPDMMLIGPTVREEISFGLFNLGLSEEMVRERIDYIVNLLEISGLLDRAPHTLSGGEKKIVSIASVLVMKPEIILFDEPTASLDPVNVERLLQVFKILEKEGISIMISTHDLDFAWKFASSIFIIKEGEIIAKGQRKRILRDEALLDSVNLKEPAISKLERILED